MADISKTARSTTQDYHLDEQVGYLLRRAYQRNCTIFSDKIDGALTPMQFSVMHRLAEMGPMSQNFLGRSVAMDGATTKGVVDRLSTRGLLHTERDPKDKRRQLVSLTDAGQAMVQKTVAGVLAVTTETLSPLRARERETLIRLLQKIV
ncbi:MarR family winged helix-turn-helix transcriptional regulator [Alloyangia pacifica]|uniref:MarR family winged helix-turn-helix transcriptional regulator n=1 Tax=Alloyangia pacifica TaxID=311180 RepID=UPI001CD6B63A|nr:MarR family transcriptional regulator [Alloyangia pacifica]MCA0995540.1 MarR family transcriptional regulator [Alloyangia pacifica]